jgi:hypothetical protein
MHAIARAAFFSCTLAVTFARADDAKDRCKAAYAEAQTLRDDRKLTQAHARLVECAQPACAWMAADCTTWLKDVEARQPTVAFAARDRNGDLTDVRVIVDGAVVLTHLDGHSLDLDPGEHKLRFESAGHVASEQTIVALESQKGRSVVATLELERAEPVTPPPPPPPQRPIVVSRPVPATAWVFGGVALASFVASGVFAGAYMAGRGNLDACKPGCQQSAIDDVAWKGVVSDVTLIAGGVSLVLGAIFFFTRPTRAAAVGSITTNGVRFAF